MTDTTRALLGGVTLFLISCSTTQAQTEISFPVLRGFHPVAIQTAAASEVELRASNDLRGASRVMVAGEGVTAEILPPALPEVGKTPIPPLLKLKLRFTVSAGALPGPRHVRLLSPRGISTLAEIVVVRNTVLPEAADNNTLAKAQSIASLPAVVCGEIEAKEDVDCYRFHLDAPQSLVFHVWSQRLQHTLHDLRGRRCSDPILTLRTAAGATLAASDNEFSDDPCLQHDFQQPGDYVLEIRDVRYHGWAEYWPYAIEINSRPLVALPHPLVVAPGKEARLSLAGFHLPAQAGAVVTLPENATEGLHMIAPSVNGTPANSFPILATRLPLLDEPAGNNDSPDVATMLSFPVCVAGRIEVPGDIDCFAFDAKKGNQFTFACLARQAGSSLDGLIRILNDKGEPIAEADDTKYSLFTLADPTLEWTAPADGRFVLELRDVVAAGGPRFSYALQASRSQPRLSLEINSDTTRLAPGTSSPIYVRVERKGGFTGDVQLAVEGLPAGITAECGRILSTGIDGCLILKAAADSTTSAAKIRITGTATHAQSDGTQTTLSATGRPLAEIMQDGGGRGLVPVDQHIVSIAEPMEVRAIRLKEGKLTLKPGESKPVEVTIERAAGYKGNITLDALYQHLGIFGDSLPKGVTVDTGASRAILTGDATAGNVMLKAAADAPAAADQLIPIMAHVSVNFTIKLTVCEPLRVTVEPATK